MRAAARAQAQQAQQAQQAEAPGEGPSEAAVAGEHEGAPEGDAAPALPGPFPALDSFVGRRRELVRLRALLRTTRLLTLTGPGGVGKTRLALELADRTRRGRGHRVLLVELDALRDGDRLAQAVAAALGAGERGGRTGVDALVRTLNAAKTLLVLDNCEHLVEPCAQLAGMLLRRCTGLRILATSRESLRVAGEVVFRVPELPVPEVGEGDAMAAVAGSDAARLFVERAKASEPGFVLLRDNARTVAEICRRLDGLPLAIELAAGRAGALPLGDILAGLDNQLALLTDGSRTGPGRHRELKATIEWSCRLLEPVEQTAFRRLSVLVGGFDAAGARAVCADDGDGDVDEDGDGGIEPASVLALVCALEAKSLISRVPGDGDRARFRLLDPIRAYGMECLAAAGELDATRERAAAWLADLAEAWSEPAFADLAIGPLAEEQQNLAEAVEFTAARRDPRQLRLAVALARVWYQQEHFSAVRSVLGGALERAPGLRGRSEGLALAARTACAQGDHAEGLRLAEEAVRIERGRDHPAGLVNALDALALTRLATGEPAAAVEVFRQALELARSLGRPLDTAVCRHHVAWALLHVGEAAAARELLAECLPVLRDLAPLGELTAAQHTNGAAHLALGETDAARDMFAEVLGKAPLESFHALYPLEGLAIVAFEHGDMQRALRLSAAAVALRQRLDIEPEAEWQRQVDTVRAQAESRLSRSRAQAAVAAGRRLRGDRLLAYALGDAAGGCAGRVRPGGGQQPWPALTEREWQVADLVGEGLTNRQIGAKLSLSASTVATHLDNIRDKSGLRSRTQIALWVAARSVDGDPADGMLT